MKDSRQVLREPFDVEVHKQTFINYLEVIIKEDGEIVYAVPSHQEKLIELSCEKLGISRDELNDRCPQEYFFDFLPWLTMQSGGVSVWNTLYVGRPNEKQKKALEKLKEEGLYMGNLREEETHE